MPETMRLATRFLQKTQLLLQIVNLLVFYFYFRHAAEIGLASGRYGADCPGCTWVFRSQWHHLAADGIASLVMLPVCWISLQPGRRWWELALLWLAPVAVVLIYRSFSGPDWYCC